MLAYPEIWNEYYCKWAANIHEMREKEGKLPNEQTDVNN
jgi:hypothetical protein